MKYALILILLAGCATQPQTPAQSAAQLEIGLRLLEMSRPRAVQPQGTTCRTYWYGVYARTVCD